MGGSRLKEIRKKLNLTQSEIGDKLGIPWSRIKDMESGKQKVSPELAELMEDKFSINGWWLLTGKGNMLNKEKETLPTVCECPEDDNSDDLVSINYYPDIVAAAGYGGINEDFGQPCQVMKFNRQFLQEFFNIRRFETIDILRVVGDSMEPFVHDGEVVMIERHNEARNGETVIANINGHVYIKKFFTDPFGKWVKLISDNGRYGEISIEGDELEYLTIVGIVRAKIKAF